MTSRKPVIAVIGTTGAGKSQMAIDIALACNGEVINADALQVYRGLDIITNKVTEEEMKGVKHHLMGFKEPHEESFVGEWSAMAQEIIDSIHSRQKLPIVVGGTSYWLQNLLFPNRIVAENLVDVETIRAKPHPELQARIDELNVQELQLFSSLPLRPPTASDQPAETLQLWKLLEALDPEMAGRWHWKDSRKVLRNLEIIAEKGRPASDVVKDQDRDSVNSRYRSLILWPYAPADILNPRLDRRVDGMISAGLIKEIKSFRESTGVTMPDYTSGIYQAIGFKEFHDYLASQSEESFLTGVDFMKLATRKYAKYQIKWIRQRFLPLAQAAPETETYLIDTSNAEQWTQIEAQVTSLAQDFLSHKSLPAANELTPWANDLLISPTLSKPSSALSRHKKIRCDLCSGSSMDPFLVVESEWEAHVRSNGHQGRIRRQKNREKNMKWILLKEQRLQGNSIADASTDSSSKPESTS